MAQQALNGMQVGACLKQMRCERVAEHVNAALLGDAGVVFSRVKDLLCRTAVQWAFAVLTQKQPRQRSILLPILPELLQNTHIKQTNTLITFSKG